MPHQRNRLILDLLDKRLKLFPIVGLLGARQTGKSTLLRDLLSKIRSIKYVTLDREEMRGLAQKQPTLFVQNLESKAVKTICIDEIQKVPSLFDTLKAEVDQKKRPGRFMVSGSTEFSKKTGVQESLTGRIALLRLFPLNLSEILKPGQQLTLKEVRSWFDRGGMPGIFAVREEANREALYDSWLETTCTRDLAQFGIPRFNPDLARRILLAIARAEVPNRTEVAKALGKQSRQIENYIQAFKALFVLYEVEPFKTSVGKPYLYLFDSGVAQFAGSSLKRRYEIWFLNECLSYFSYSGATRPDVFYYESSRGSRIDFLVASKSGEVAFQLCDEEAPSSYTLRSAEAFLVKHPKIPVKVLAPCLYTQKVADQLEIVSWTQVGQSRFWTNVSR